MRVCSALMALATACLLASCAGNVELAAHLRPLPTDTMMLLGKKGMDVQAPIFVRIFKEESELELWKQRDDGHFYHFKTYPICNWSGDLGPKVRYGDRQAPEGFYTITREQMNPDSKYHLALNLGYPNAFDRAWKRNGDFLMIHGSCKSAGCYAMTDALIEEIYAIARESFIGGSDSVRGYERNRFAGDASVVGNSEIDVAIGKFNAAVPFRWGLTGLADVGRVFVANESSSKWHYGFGGGLWLGVFASGVNLQFASALKATVVHSDEGTAFYLLSGFSL